MINHVKALGKIGNLNSIKELFIFCTILRDLFDT
jgi:hypothetical protein